MMGGGAQMINWPEGFCTELVSRGVQVIRFDNRETGLSSHFPEAPVPDLRAALAGDFSSASYTLSDMAADTIGPLDVLGFDRAHIVGASLSGMIAQTIAIGYPGRVRSLTSMMSATGNRSVGQPNLAAIGGVGRHRRTVRASSTGRSGPSGWSGRQGSSSTRTQWPIGPDAPTTGTTSASAWCASPSRPWPPEISLRGCGYN